ncbi:MAG: glycyl-radical enzyme activating protein [Desulfotalea sp.]
MSSLIDNKKNGIVFSIQKYSVHDGPGIRTIAFLKGCPLRCKWCSNPESQKKEPELAYNPNKCLGLDKCVRCLDVCTDGSIGKGKDEKVIFDRELHNNIDFADACPAGAFNTYGEEQTVKEVLDRVEEDEMFYARSGGGMTLSGGEPFSQGEFAFSLLREAKTRRIKTAVETCGVAKWESIEPCLQYINYMLYDVKSMDDEKHIEFTGLSNTLPLENLRKIREAYPDKPIRVRTPIVPGFNDNVGDVKKIIKFIETLPGEPVEYEALEYHRMGQPKYEYLGREYEIKATSLVDGIYDKIKALADAYAVKHFSKK